MNNLNVEMGKALDLRKVRDEIVGKKALYEENARKLDESINKLKPVIDSISSETRQKLAMKGLSVDNILNVDYDRLKTDKQYLTEYKKELTSVILSVKQKLGELL